MVETQQSIFKQQHKDTLISSPIHPNYPVPKMLNYINYIILLHRMHKFDF